MLRLEGLSTTVSTLPNTSGLDIRNAAAAAKTATVANAKAIAVLTRCLKMKVRVRPARSPTQGMNMAALSAGLPTELATGLSSCLSEKSAYKTTRVLSVNASEKVSDLG